MSDMERVLRDEIAWHEQMIRYHSIGPAQPSLAAGHERRLAALTAALPAPGDAGAMQTITEEEVEAMRAAGTPIYMVDHYPAPGEISQAQAQAMREALRSIEEMRASSGKGDPEMLYEMRSIAKAALAAVPDPAA